MKHLFFSLLTILLFNACAYKYNIKEDTKTNREKLSSLISNSSVNIDKQESKRISKDLISYSLFLAKKYDVNTTALIHNTLVNLEIKEKGFCYHYANDLIKFINHKKYKSFIIKKIVAKRGEYFEHTALLLTRNDMKFKNSIVLDAWRYTGDLYFSKVIDDKSYIWEIK